MKEKTPTRPTPGLPALLTLIWVVASCGGRVSPDPDAQPDGAPSTDAWTDGGPDAIVARDAGDVQLYDAGLPPCEEPGFFAPRATRFSFFRLSVHGGPGDGLNLDNDPSCAPVGDCSNGIDNQLGSLDVANCGFETLDADGFNYILRTILEEGSAPANWLLEARGLALVGDDSVGSFNLMLHKGHWFPSATCNEATSVLDTNLHCDYLTDDDMFAPGSCESLSTVTDAEIIDGRLVAGGPSTTIWMVYTVFGLTAGLVLHNARMEADVAVDGDRLTLSNGILAGIICPEELIMALSAVLSVDPVDCEMANKIPLPDVETGCSAEAPDGISVGFTFEAHPARIVGMLRN